MKVAVFIPTRNVRAHVVGVLEQIPAAFGRACAEVFVLDNDSGDGTAEAAQQAVAGGWPFRVSVYRNRANLGYGGSQKVAYAHALRQGYDAVVMLHGDGQYPATAVPALIEALGRPGVGMAYGTRFGAAGADQTPPLRRGGVWALSALQNLVSGLRLAEWCSGFRAFRCEALARVPFAACDDDYFFDLQIILLLHLAGWRIAELPVPKQYDGAPPSGLKLARFGRRVLAHALHYPLARHGLVRDPLYDPRQWDRLGRAPVPAPVPVSVGRAA